MDSLINTIAPKIIKRGEYTLKSGLTSSVYFDFRSLISSPEILKELSRKILDLIINSVDFKCDYVCGIPSAAVPLASYVSCIGDKKLLMVRTSPKTHGTQKRIEGEYEPHSTVLLIEDTITTGGSVMECVQILREGGLIVKRIVCLLDRSGTNHPLVHSLFLLSDFEKTGAIGPFDLVNMCQNAHQRRIRDIIAKKGRVCLSLDFKNPKKVMRWIQQYGEHVAGFKIHSSMLKRSLDKNQINEITTASVNQKFFVIDDRKFSDIGTITAKQYYQSPFSGYFSIVTVQVVGGESTIQGLIKANCNIGILIVMKMSPHDNLMDEEYQRRAYEIGLKYQKNVIGFVSPNPKADLTFINFSAGVSLDAKQDNLGQHYRLPSQITADVMIVGRGIAQSGDVIGAIKRYNVEKTHTQKKYQDVVVQKFAPTNEQLQSVKTAMDKFVEKY